MAPAAVNPNLRVVRFEQIDPERVLQVRDVLADQRLGDIEFLRGTRETPRVGHGGKGDELVEVEHTKKVWGD